MPIRAIVFDLFDTLVDMRLRRFAPPAPGRAPVHSTAARVYEVLEGAVGVPFERFAEALREVDHSIARPRLAQGRELPTRERFDRVLALLGASDEALSMRLTDAHMGVLREHMSTPAHHAELLGELAGELPLALCSNFTHADTARRVLLEEALAPHLREVVISEEVGFRKPRGEIFRAVLERLGTAPEDTLHVGDDLAADVGGAAALGIRTVWITRRVPHWEDALRRHPGPPPDHRITDLGELRGLLDASS